MTPSVERSAKTQSAYCSACGHLAYPAVYGDADRCDSCGVNGVVRIEAEGTVYTFTVVHVGAPGIATPYALGYVDLEPDVRVFGRLAVGDAEIGRRVTPVFHADGLFFERCREEGGS